MADEAQDIIDAIIKMAEEHFRTQGNRLTSLEVSEELYAALIDAIKGRVQGDCKVEERAMWIGGMEITIRQPRPITDAHRELIKILARRAVDEYLEELGQRGK